MAFLISSATFPSPLTGNILSKAKTAKKKAAPKKAVKKTAKRKAPKKAKAASAAAILGYKPVKTAKQASDWRPVNAGRIKPEWKKYYDILRELRARLLDQMSDLKKESAEEMTSYSMHMADSGTDNFDRDSALSLLSSDQDAVYEIEEALQRIEKDSYGVCEITGKPIPKSRLNAIPWTRFTVDAQAKLERDGALQRRKLGSLGTIDGASGSKEADEPVETPKAKAKKKAAKKKAAKKKTAKKAKTKK